MYNNVAVHQPHHSETRRRSRKESTTNKTRILFKRIVDNNDKRKAYQLIRQFMDFEPTNIARNYSSDIKHFIWKAYVESRIQQNLSVCAIDENTNEMVGIVVNFVSTRKHQQRPAPFHPVYAPHQRFLKTLTGDVFHDLKCQKYFTMSFGYVRREYARLGVLGKLAGMSEDLANQLMCDMIITTTTSEFAFREACKRGCQPYREISYKDYEDPLTGENVFSRVPSPHSRARLMFKRINLYNNLRCRLWHTSRRTYLILFIFSDRWFILLYFHFIYLFIYLFIPFLRFFLIFHSHFLHDEQTP